MQPRWVLAAGLVAAAAVLMPSGAAGRTVRAVCNDGVPPPRTLCVAGCSRPIRCDADQVCDGTCTFAIRVCGEVACSDRLVDVAVGRRGRIRLSTALGATPTTFVLRCRAHPRGAPCQTTTTASPTTTTATITTTSTSTLIEMCPTTTSLGIPNCGVQAGLCGFPCLSGQACVDSGNGQCVCTGPVLCGGTYRTCGGECPAGTTCTAFAVPPGCPSIGCDCQ